MPIVTGLALTIAGLVLSQRGQAERGISSLRFRGAHMKGIDASYRYEGYGTYTTAELGA